MVALKVKRKQQALFLLENESTKEYYRLLFEFYNVSEPKSDDYIIIHKDLLDRKSELFAQPFAFELCVDKTFDEIKKLNNTEYAVLVTKDNKYVLKRVYG